MTQPIPSLFGPVTLQSGDVSQPWSWWYQCAPVTINQMKTPSPQTETRVVRDAASYGRQLGRMQDVLTVLISGLDRRTLDEADRAALGEYQTMIDEVAAARTGLHAANAAKLIATLEHWKRTQPALFHDLRDDLQAVLAEN
ncbi:hypothetical protein M0534_12955 [Methylonatrum kenyense]|uniref:hypothetical protein n=1 Tax=Methylonatrum kenyense TaxID=455253 RepID=UPI0020BEB6C3|nr:hypothetical protein [Methylonatrum kenyense]MCK8517224.1 hypothetical protein [Methylonatrum kenyense]